MKTSDLILPLALLGILMLMSREALASFGNDTANSSLPFDYQPSDTQDGIMTVELSAKIDALLGSIRQFESNGDYSVLYGGSHFTDFSRHPNTWIPINLPGYEGKGSTAAGAYQINYPTYKEFAPRLGITDFSAPSQDAIARAILESTGAVMYLANDDIQGAFKAASKRWASLPGSTANQHPVSYDVAYSDYLSRIA